MLCGELRNPRVYLVDTGHIGTSEPQTYGEMAKPSSWGRVRGMSKYNVLTVCAQDVHHSLFSPGVATAWRLFPYIDCSFKIRWNCLLNPATYHKPSACVVAFLLIQLDAISVQFLGCCRYSSREPKPPDPGFLCVHLSRSFLHSITVPIRSKFLEPWRDTVMLIPFLVLGGSSISSAILVIWLQKSVVDSLLPGIRRHPRLIPYPDLKIAMMPTCQLLGSCLSGTPSTAINAHRCSAMSLVTAFCWTQLRSYKWKTVSTACSVTVWVFKVPVCSNTIDILGSE